ncbi:MAG: hypothetical protein WCH29_01375 [Chitinophagaceae bacterium]
MKKMTTLLLSIALVSSAFAQYGSRDQQDNGNRNNGNYGNNRDIQVNDDRFQKDRDAYRYHDRDNFSRRDLDIQIAQINREYDYRIQSIKNKYFMNRFRKEQMIYVLEDQRRDDIKRLWMKFNYRGYRGDDRYYGHH